MGSSLCTTGMWIAAFSLTAVFLAAPSAAPQATGALGAGAQAAAVPIEVCADSVIDQNGGPCLQASSVPASGMLFPPPHDGGVGNVLLGPECFIGGGTDNTAGPGGVYAIVGHATVGGGRENYAYGSYSTVSGGLRNEATGVVAGTVGGGRDNIATGQYAATIAGGQRNTVSGETGAIGGGGFNTVSGGKATVPGGWMNVAAGTYSFAAGRRAHAIHNGSFVWGDNGTPTKTSSASGEFNVYAYGGTRIFSNSAATTGVLLAPGGGSWTSVSDRAAKENIEPVEGREVLERLAQVPIHTWNYRAQEDSIRHMGPMAQDFFAAFGLGLGDRSIDTIDPDGVALAGIQALNEQDTAFARQLAERDARIATLEERLARLEAALARGD